MKIVSKRKSEMWVSNNRVLVGGNKKFTGRNPNFDTDETKLLISLWGDPKVQKTLITTHKKHAVIAKLAEKMRDYGYHRSAEEINTRIKNLKCFYNRIKKDQEIGVNTIGPTWKHFNAMDEIMTRPIFSVRPNEIPKPSLRYKLEEARREREERLAEQAENNRDGGGGGDMDADDNNGISDIEDIDNNDDDENNTRRSLSHDTNSQFHNEMSNNNIDNEMVECVEEKPKLKELDDNITMANLRRKENNSSSNSSSDVEDTTINIKDEPIEVDDDNDDIGNIKEKDEDESDTFPLSEYIKLTATNSNSNNNKIITTIATSLNKETPPIITTTTQSQLKLSQPTTILLNKQPTNSIVSTQTTQGKISLVPTNFLMKSPTTTNQQQIQIQPQQIQIQQQSQQQQTQQLQLRHSKQSQIQPQHRIIYTQSGGPTNSGIVNTNNGPMKVLLVNTLQKGNQQQQGATITATTPTPTIVQQKPIDIQNKTTIFTTAPNATIQTVNQQQQRLQKTTTVNLSSMVSSANVDKINLIASPSKNPTGYRALLGQLIKVQSEGNEINRQRMQIEKDRLLFEQSLADKFLNNLPSFTNLISSFMTQQQPTTAKEQDLQIPIIQKPENISISKISSNNEKISTKEVNDNNITETLTLQLLTPKTEKED